MIWIVQFDMVHVSSCTNYKSCSIWMNKSNFFLIAIMNYKRFIFYLFLFTLSYRTNKKFKWDCQMKGTKWALLKKHCWIDSSDVLFSILWNKGITISFYPQQCIWLYHCSVFQSYKPKASHKVITQDLVLVRLLDILWFKIITFHYYISIIWYISSYFHQDWIWFMIHCFNCN